MTLSVALALGAVAMATVLPIMATAEAATTALRILRMDFLPSVMAIRVCAGLCSVCDGVGGRRGGARPRGRISAVDGHRWAVRMRRRASLALPVRPARGAAGLV
ncbi:hypothetical protein SVIO_000320 [Streptomyces violaceusniger]|uniref:Secreted protein n=1 Tax=Streptomyces violaceusniger TaxID=68280 RepID=A0A4D4KU71_STRVO|nr:hypothetical protein SVIO_000320 [Streptomyces violaceusniger]